mgnify:FL=1|jgi:hypothetical protein|tara:strand:- start:2178 stop:2444 length:267 start_codon:yes stop_codon:yes gene_type:complete
MSEEATWTYTNEVGRYDVALLSGSGKEAFNLLLEVNDEIQTFRKRTAVLQAAAVQLNSVIQDGLTEEALIEATVIDDNDDEVLKTKEN